MTPDDLVQHGLSDELFKEMVKDAEKVLPAVKAFMKVITAATKPDDVEAVKRLFISVSDTIARGEEVDTPIIVTGVNPMSGVPGGTPETL